MGGGGEEVGIFWVPGLAGAYKSSVISWVQGFLSVELVQLDHGH